MDRFNKEPLYQLEVESLFSFSILINGCPVYSNFDKISGMVRLDINPYILKSGKQLITVELYPGYDQQNMRKQFLENGSKFSLKIEKTGWGKEGYQSISEEILSYKTADETTDLTKLQTYKRDISFNASVPYRLEGWKNGKDLTQLDKKQLEEQVLHFYKQIISLFERNDYDALNSQFMKADAEWYQSMYFSEDIITRFQTTKGRKAKSVMTMLSGSQQNSRTFFPLENYVLRFYGDGRMVRLEPTEGINKGESLLGYVDDKNGMSRRTFVDMLLYIPKGETALKIVR
ncbi:hypothetical protein U0038_01825 [Sphingobacterium spiritivorum]|uniref:hypothetical protein n=1 Tax=Sphingobacterium spiritivorum TaxID=258 RepID=UPI001F242D05|nr:hypothetical protein [Sphingobacterium spiritivorum]WQD36281.1 hypothetical protein U0038_01825 [Sphingobacterium spiritivorum]